MTAQMHLRVVGHGDLPQPLIPADVVMTDLPAFLFDIDEMTQSDWNTDATDTEWRVGITLYARSFRQKPCGSLPDEDRHLAAICGFGRDIDGFRRVRARALDGWQKCSDGRLYRVDVAKNVLTVWIERVLTRRSSAIAHEKRWGGEKGAFEMEAYERSLAGAIAALGQIDKQNPVLRRLKARSAKQIEGEPAGNATRIATGTATGNAKGSEAEAKPSVSAQSADAARARDPKPTEDPEQETEQRQGRKPISKPDEYPPDGFEQAWARWCGRRIKKADAKRAYARIAKDRLVSFDEILSGIERYRIGKPRDWPWQHFPTWLNGKGWEDDWTDPEARQGRAGPPTAAKGPRDPVLQAREQLLEELGHGH